MMMATPRRIISWDTNKKQMRFTTPTPEGKSRKRTAGTFDSDGTHHHPPLEKKSDASNKVDDVSPLAATEMQPRARPRKSPLPSRVPAAAAVVQQTAQPLAIASSEGAEYRGVYWMQKRQNFHAQVKTSNGKTLYVGRSADAKEAAFMRDRAWRDLGKDPSKLNFDDTVPIPDEYLASVAKASKKTWDFLVGQKTAQQPSSAPSAENEDDGGALLEAAQHEHEIPLAADDDDEDGGALLEAAQHDHEVPPAAASSPTTTIINNHYHYHYHYNIHNGASATFHINNNSSPAAAGIPNTHHHVAQSPSAE